MKIIIGVTQSGRFSPQVESIASEFFGESITKIHAGKKDKNILWFLFPSKKNAIEFMQAIPLKCVNENNKVFK